MPRKFKTYFPTDRKLRSKKYAAVTPWYYKYPAQLAGGIIGARTGAGGLMGPSAGFNLGWEGAGQFFSKRLFRKSRKRGTGFNWWTGKGSYGVGSNTPSRRGPPVTGSNPGRVTGSNPGKVTKVRVSTRLGLGMVRRKRAHPNKWIRYG